MKPIFFFSLALTVCMVSPALGHKGEDHAAAPGTESAAGAATGPIEVSEVAQRNLGLTVVAEGVASREAWDLVEAVGCDIAQGYFVSRPLPKDKLTEWLYRWDVPTTVAAQLPGRAGAHKRVAGQKKPGSKGTPLAHAAGRVTGRSKRP